MSKGRIALLATGTVAIVLATAALWLVLDRPGRPRVKALLAAFDIDNPPGGVTVQYPFDRAVFPPGIVAPEFRWEDASGASDVWLVSVAFAEGEQGISVIRPTQSWTPSESQWRAIQARSTDSLAKVTVLGFRGTRWPRITSSARLSIGTSPDEVGAPIFYREVNLPFRDAVNDPSRIRWRFGDVTASQPPPVVLEKLPVCGNCHSFSANGQVLGMDVDYASDKGSYAIVPVSREMVLEPSKIITWSDYEPDKEEVTLGLLSQVSPSGKYVAGTVKDDTVFAPMPDLAFSQLFFPIKGIVAIYSRENGTYQALPGADDPRYVQTNPVWSPDGQWIVFARSKKYDHAGKGRITSEECKVFTEQGQPFRYDLYRVPFNDGRGGKAEPLAGASANGMSNYFPRYSPDGKWIVFCKAKKYMLLQPDSELYILPSGGGQARRLACNTSRMNSWHSWSPNGKWMVFSSKALSPYTQLFLTHFDEAGNSSPPVLLANFTEPQRAANIPEFVCAESDAIQTIREQFVDDYSYQRQAKTNIDFDDLVRAEASARKALSLNPDNARALFHLATVKLKQGKPDETVRYLTSAVESDPELFEAQYSLGIQLMNSNRVDEAIEHLEAAVRLHPNYEPTRYHLALALQQEDRFEESLSHFRRLLKLNPDSTPALAQMAYILATCPRQALRDYDAAVEMAERACKLTQYSDPEFLATLARVYLAIDRKSEALTTAQRAVTIARSRGREDFARRVERDFRRYWQLPPSSSADKN